MLLSKLSPFVIFLKKYKAAILAALLFVLLCYSFMLTHYTLQIDEETWIKNTDTQLIKNIWVNQGRFGLYFFDRIFSPLGRYVPVLWDILAVLIYFSAGIVFAFSFYMVNGDFNKFSIFAFLSVFPAVPFVNGDFLSFSMFNFQQSLAMLTISAGFLCTLIYFAKKKKRYFFLSIALGFASVSFFQAFASVYITAVAAYLVMAQLKCEYHKKELIKNVLHAFIIFIVFILGYFAMNVLLNNIFSLSGAAYSGGYVGWSGNIGENMLYTLLGAAKVIIGYGAIGGAAIIIIEAAFIVVSAKLIKSRKGALNRLWLGVSMFLFFISPFLMNFALLNWRFLGRILLSLSLALALELLIFINFSFKCKRNKVLSCIVVGIVLFVNAGSMNWLFFGNYLSYEEDKAFSEEIIMMLEEKNIDYENKPILFVGQISKVTARDKYVQSSSFFSWDDGNNKRIHDFLKAEGYNTINPANDLRTVGYYMSENMPCWPATDSIKSSDKIIVIKFSEPSEKWFVVNGITK